MSISKRIIALAAAGAAALLVSGGFGALHTSTSDAANYVGIGAVGCTPTTNNLDISFTTNPVTGLMTSQIQNTFGLLGTPVNGVTGVAVLPATLSLATPGATVLCGTVLQSTFPPFVLPPSPVDVDHVDPGNITVRATGPAVILESNSNNYSYFCGASVTAFSCQGGIPNAGGTAATTNTLVSPAQGNTFHVQLLQGTGFGIIGVATPVIGLSATWNSNLQPVPAGQPLTYTTPTYQLTVALPVYAVVLSVNPGTIPAALPTSTSVQGAVVTASMYRVATGTTCVPLVAGGPLNCAVLGGVPGVAAGVFGGGNINGQFLLSPGSESGTINFQTNLGVWAAVGATPAGPSLVAVTGATQIVSAHCGGIPGQIPTILVPTTGLVQQLGLTQCQSVTATLVGGGEAGTATVVVNFVGDFTGAQAVQETTVNLTPGPITVPLSTGCNEVLTPPNLAFGANGAAVAALASGFNVTSIWVFNNASHTFQALYFAPAGPTDIVSVGPNQSVFVCGTGAGTFKVSSV